MSEWAKIASTPLGLAALSLYLIYKMLFSKSSNDFRWLPKALFLFLATTLMCSALYLAYFELRERSHNEANKRNATVKSSDVQQTTTGPGSPAIQNVNGPVTVTVDQSGEKLDHSVDAHKPQKAK